MLDTSLSVDKYFNQSRALGKFTWHKRGNELDRNKERMEKEGTD